MLSADQSGWPSGASAGPTLAACTLSFIVVGAGISGLGAAIALRRAGHHVVLVESDVGLDLAPERARGLRMPPNMTKIMNRWGYGERLGKIGVVARRIAFVHFETGELLAVHHLVRDLVRDAGGEFFLTEHHRFLALLLDIAKELGVDVRFGCHVAQIGPDYRSVVLESGETLRADVVVGADGILGPTRTLIEPNNLVASAGSELTTYCSVIPGDKIKAEPELLKLVTEANIDDGVGGYDKWAWTGAKCAAMLFPTSVDGDCALFLWMPEDGAGAAWGDVVDKEVVSRDIGALKAEPRLRKLASLSNAVRIKTQLGPHLSEYVHSSETILAIGEAAHPSVRGQFFGPAMSLEDAAALGKLFSHAVERAQIPSFLDAFSELRSTRSTRMTTIDSETLTFVTLSDSAAEQRNANFRERHAAGQDALTPSVGDDTGATKVLVENHEIFGYDAEDAADGWWVSWGILRLHAEDSPQVAELSRIKGVAITREEH